MKKTILLLIVTLLASVNIAQSQPHYMTEAEKELLRTYQYPGSNQRDNNPPPTPVRTMAEWEECQGFVIKWTQFTPILTEIVRYGCQEGLVFILATDTNTVRTALTNASIPLTNIRFIRGYTTSGSNTIWSRDYGPWAVYSGVADSLKLIDWIYNRPRPGDDTNSVTIGQYINVPVHRTLVSPNDLVNTGGNFMVDGHGTGFASKLILSENAAGNRYGVSGKTEAQINSIMNIWMGIGLNRYIKMDSLPYDQIHHIDMHMKLLDEETLLVGQYPAGIADGPQIEANLQYVLNNFQTCFGKPYKVVRIPMPPEGTIYPPSGDYRTYTNSLIINRTVLVPIYASPYDTTALRIYREAMPGYKIYGINSNAIIPSFGTIHCITKEIGVKEPVFISHSAIRNTTNQGAQFVKSYIKTKSGVASASLYWRTDTTLAYSQIPMTAAGADTFTASIPGQVYGKTVYYYISANSNSGRTVTKPLTAPSGYIKYHVLQPVTISNEPANITSYSLSQNYPNPFNPATKINYTLPKGEFVTLKVYDINGKEIASLVNSYQTPGSYNFTFDGSRLSSGVYFYRILAGSFSEYRSMILLK